MTPVVPITGDTRVAELLQAYPHLEDLLVRQAPAFKMLKNPILRRTVARVATLRKAAQMGGIPVQQLVGTLREAAGLPAGETGGEEAEPGQELSTPPGELPDWVDVTRVKGIVDADALLARGEFPLSSVQELARDLGPGELVSVTSEFHPAPLLDALAKQGFRTCVVQEAPSLFRTYVSRSS